MFFLKLILGAGMFLSESGMGDILLVELGLADPEILLAEEFVVPVDGRIGVDFDFNVGVENADFAIPQVVIIESDEAASEIPPETTRLVLTGEAVTDKSMEYVAKLENLEYLEATENQITDAGIKQIEHLGSLTTLNLTGSKVTDQVVESINRFRNLESLVLSKTAISTEFLVQVKELPQLETLRLSETRIDDAGMMHLQKFPKLTELSLRDLNLTDHALKPISELKDLNSLDLSGTKVGHDLSALERARNVIFLSLNRTQIVPGELSHLTKLPRLFKLDLIDAKIDDEAIPYLARLKYPYGLYVKGTQISDSGMKTLRKSLPFYAIDLETDDYGESSIFERGTEIETAGGHIIMTGTRLTSEELKLLELDDEEQIELELPEPAIQGPNSP